MGFEHQLGRRYDLDWLRIIAFGLLIFYHIGMLYVTWDFHVKSPHAGEWPEPFMRLLNPWRLLLLFFISGIAARFMLDKTSKQAFAKERLWRLFIPLFIGIQFVVAPQTYFELLQTEEISPGFWAFFANYSDPNHVYSVTTPTWNHLWYVVYLLVYSFILVGISSWIKALINSPVGRFISQFPAWILVLVLPVLPLLLVRFTLASDWPTTHNLVEDWAKHGASFSMFLIGYIVAKSPNFWRAIDQMRFWSVGLAIGLIIPLSLLWLQWDVFASWATQNPERESLLLLARIGRVLYAWLVIAALLGFAQRWLNKPNRTLSYLTSVIFPYYILHQTLLISIAYPLGKMDLPLVIEGTAVVGGTIAGCVLITHFIIRPVPLFRVFFGMKAKPDKTGEVMK